MEPENPEENDFEWQLKQEQEEQWKRDNGYIYTDPNDGTSYEWDPEKQAWFPRVDEDFIASYQASYGIDVGKSQEGAATDQTPEAQSTSETAASSSSVPTVGEAGCQVQDGTSPDQSHDSKEGRPPDQAGKETQLPVPPQQLYRFQKMQAKRKAEEKTWFEVDPTKNTNVYISGLPLDITMDEFQELMTKYGIIMVEEETEKPKIKLYLDEQGRPKGDGRCCYLKRESVDLAIQLLDESEVRGHKIHVEVATFTLKGDYKPPPKKKKSKKKKGTQQAKLLDWRPEKSFTRKRNEQVIIFKHVFHPDEFEEDAMLINDIKDDLKAECSKYGEVKKVLIFDRHPEGVSSVKFKDAECADACVNALNGRWFAQRKLEVFTWDGKTDYKIEETDKEREERMKKWEDFLEEDDDEEEDKNVKTVVGKTEELKELAKDGQAVEEEEKSAKAVVGKTEELKVSTKDGQVEEEEMEEEEEDDDEEEDQSKEEEEKNGREESKS